MKIAIAQINCTVGDIAGNTTKIINAVNYAKQSGAELIITPELALSGYPPADLLLRKNFNMACEKALAKLSQKITNITLVVGHPCFLHGKLYNTASIICNGRIINRYHKRILCQPPFFNEDYYFDAGSEPCCFELGGIKFGINICSDFWLADPPAYPIHPDIDVLLVLSASPYYIDKQVTRYQNTYQFVQQTGKTVIHANLVGGQDEFVFDGASFVMNSQGKVTHQFEEFAETTELIELQNVQQVKGQVMTPRSSTASIYQALCLAVKDYVNKNEFPSVLLGLSGGVDSALTLAIAVDALGAEKVKTVMLPSQYTADISLHDAQQMASLLNVKHYQSSIKPIFEQLLETLATDFQIQTDDSSNNTMPENLQARIRGVLIMAISNQTGALVLTTGNKSEMAVGYCTLYGDMAGGFAVLKDVSKSMVYQLCEYRNQQEQVIPERIIRRAPSAELRPDQTDQDSLPPYEILDAIIEAYVEQNCSTDEIIDKGYSEADVKQTIHLIHLNEYKRRQAPLGPRITRRDFGTAWHYPVTSRYKP